MSETKDLTKKLSEIQKELKCKKNQRNKFGNYNYRSCEDILEAVKPILFKQNMALTLSDEIVLIGDRYYVKALAELRFEGDMMVIVAYARETDIKKGMDSAQITGSASSYARKYALNGLFAIDDTKDSDATNDHGKNGSNYKQPEEKKTPEEVGKEIDEAIGGVKPDVLLEDVLFIATKKGFTKKSVEATAKRDYKKTLDKLTKEELTKLFEYIEQAPAKK
ncbi:hypothetical protein CMI41_00015 [Candidatus Pacearchaeota archaeon]|nr:hypothetical protein [Candidatus Pacearchaeota archaeon]|tara:strand:+ start:5198 stop:5860 length:663 start_codon:yes stop_codon:yes gene_type:complete